MNIDAICAGIRARDPRLIGRAISIVEDGLPGASELLEQLDRKALEAATVIGITGPPGVGKSTLTDQIIAEYRRHEKRLGVIAIDPSSPLSGGAILGDRVRMMKHALDADVVVRSMATRGRIGGVCAAAGAAIRILASSGCDPILIETVGVGQDEIDVVRIADVTMLVLAPGLGDDIQAMKAGLVELCDVLVVNKGDLPGADALVKDLQSATHDRGCLLFETSAAKGDGITALVKGIGDRDDAARASGSRARRRERALRAEIRDWALEMIRPWVERQTELLGSAYEEPRRAAEKIVSKMTAQITV